MKFLRAMMNGMAGNIIMSNNVMYRIMKKGDQKLLLSFYLWYKYLFRKTVYMKDIQSGIQSEFSPFDSGSGLDICFIGVSYDSVRGR